MADSGVDPLPRAANISRAWIADRLEILAGDAMEGRDNQTAGGAAARAYLIEELRALGLTPYGEAGFE